MLTESAPQAEVRDDAKRRFAIASLNPHAGDHLGRNNAGVDLKHAFEDYAPAIVRFTVKTPAGDLSNGAGFHIGDGFVITARHVLDGNVVESISSEGNHHRDRLEISATYYPTDERIDLAAIRTNFDQTHRLTMVSYAGDDRRNAAKTDRIPLGYHLDDWVGDEFVLSRVLVMGYPRVPFWREVGLVTVVGEVNAVMDRYDTPHPHFIISPVARRWVQRGTGDQ